MKKLGTSPVHGRLRMNIKYLFLTLLMICFSSQADEPVMLVDSLNLYCCDFEVLDTGEIVFAGNEGGICIVSPDTPMEVSKLEIQWAGQLDEWRSTGDVTSLSTNHSGSMICFSQFIRLPENMNIESDFYIPVPLLVGVCGSDGSDARLMGLSIEVGGGPIFDFTSDSRYVFGNPFLECLPTPEAYAGYITDEAERLEDFLMVNIETGERSGNPSIIGDGYYLNPYSDLAAAGWYPPNVIIDIETQEVLLEDTCIDNPTIIYKWVLPYAGLARVDGGQILRYSSGREVENAGDALTVYCRLTDGRYVFSTDDGNTVMTGSIDWENFEAPDAVEIPELAGILGSYCTMKPVPGSSGAVFRSEDALYYIELPMIQDME